VSTKSKKRTVSIPLPFALDVTMPQGARKGVITQRVGITSQADSLGRSTIAAILLICIGAKVLKFKRLLLGRIDKDRKG
jgi:hypothetical protein